MRYIYPYCFVAECGNVGVIVDGDHVQGGGVGGGGGSGGGSGSGSDSGEHMDADTRARELARRKEEARRKRRKKKRTGSSLVSSCFQGNFFFTHPHVHFSKFCGRMITYHFRCRIV